MGEIILNPFDESGYDMATMTQSLNLIKNNYGRVRSMNLFSLDPVTTRTVIIEYVKGVLTLLPTMPVGSPATMSKHDKSKMLPFIIPHIPHSDRVLPGDIQGVREFGSGSQTTSLQSVMAKRLLKMRLNHAITEEHLLMGALKGIVLDADGSVVLHNFFTAFGVTPKTVNFALTTGDTKVREKCLEVVRHIEDNMDGDTLDHVHCLCDSTFFDAIIGHANVEKFWIEHEKALEIAGSTKDPRHGFRFGNIVFEEYRGSANAPNGSTVKFVAAGTAHFFPVGTSDTFKIHHAPANLMETVNTMGQPLYARQDMDTKGRWVDIYTESNPFPICRRPATLVKGSKS